MSHAAVLMACQIPEKSGFPSAVLGMAAEPCARTTLAGASMANDSSIARIQKVGRPVSFTDDLLVENPLSNESARCLPEHIAGAGSLDVELHVRRQQKALVLELLGCLLHRSHVSIMILVAFLERQARITGLHPFCLRRLERDVLTVGFAAVVFAEAGAAQRPARRRRDRRLDGWKADSR